MTYEILIDGKVHRLEIDRGEQSWRCRIDDRQLEVDAILARPDVISLIIGGAAYEVKRERAGSDLHLWVKNVRFATEVRDPRSLRSRRAARAGMEGPQKLTAPMPGKIVRVLAGAGAEVDAGQGLVVIEAMKMQNELKSPKKGVVKQILAAEGAAVNAGEVLAVVE